MAAHIDRQWVNKEISDFNKSVGDYALERGELDRLAEKIAFHLRMKDRIADIKSFLERSRDEDTGEVDTSAMELVKELNPETYARQMDYSKVESSSKVVSQLIGEEDGDTKLVASFAIYARGKDEVELNNILNKVRDTLEHAGIDWDELGVDWDLDNDVDEDEEETD
jgi:hypothetical protein